MLRTLHAALDDAERRTSLRRGDAEALQVALASLLERCRALAAEAGVVEAATGRGRPPHAVIASAQRVLDRVDCLVLQARRRDELVAEDAVLAAEESAMRAVERRRRPLARARSPTSRPACERSSKSAGIRIPEGDPTAALAAFHHGV